MPVTQVEELDPDDRARACGRFQMYLPNNPIYQRAEQAIRDAFLPIWSSTPAADRERRGDRPRSGRNRSSITSRSRQDSFAWMLYKDGMRVLTLRPGVEDEEIIRFLQVATRARLLASDAARRPADAALGAGHSSHIEYQFAEIITDSLTVLDPQAWSDLHAGRAGDPGGPQGRSPRGDATRSAPGAGRARGFRLHAVLPGRTGDPPAQGARSTRNTPAMPAGPRWMRLLDTFELQPATSGAARRSSASSTGCFRICSTAASSAPSPGCCGSSGPSRQRVAVLEPAQPRAAALLPDPPQRAGDSVPAAAVARGSGGTSRG